MARERKGIFKKFGLLSMRTVAVQKTGSTRVLRGGKWPDEDALSVSITLRQNQASWPPVDTGRLPVAPGHLDPEGNIVVSAGQRRLWFGQ